MHLLYILPTMVRIIGLFAGPLLFGAIQLFAGDALSPEQWFVISTATWMLAWWLTEAVPIPVTALLPIVLFPLGGVLDINVACQSYGHKLVFLFLGGFILALGIEKWGLHKRIALGIIARTGERANHVILGFMIASAFLSMWISNTATTVMMLPIATSVVGVLLSKDSKVSPKQQKVFALTLMLGVAYAANIGGIGTLIGTPPNIAMKGAIEDTYNITISFAHWMVLATPFSVVLLVLTFLVLTRVVYRNGIGAFDGASEVIKTQLKGLGKMGKGETRVLLVFVATAALWILRGVINDGLHSMGSNINISDTGIAIAGGIALFLLPSGTSDKKLLDWDDTRSLPWGILLLFGGGLALAAGFKNSGLITVVADAFQALEGMEMWAFILVLTASALFLTELMSNLALVQVLVPVVASVAYGLDIDPLMFAVPVTIAASCAFMFPMSTPPNAIVFASGHVRIAEMARAGILLNLLAIALIAVLSTYFLGIWLSAVPEMP